MGRREFWTWVEQANREQQAGQPSPHSWRGTEQDEGWARMRAERDKRMGRG